MKPYIIGICGGTASGKSTLAEKIKAALDRDAAIIHQDNYYKPNDNLSMAERESINYDTPDAIDTSLLYSHLTELKNGKAIESPLYDFSEHNRTKATAVITPREIIIIEGLQIFHEKKLRELMNLKIFIDEDADVRLLRKINRDIVQRKRTLEYITKQYLTTVKPMHEKYIEPTKKYADLIVKDIKNEDEFNGIIEIINKQTMRGAFV